MKPQEFRYGDMVILTKGTKGIKPGTMAMFASYDGDGGAFVEIKDNRLMAQIDVKQLKRQA